MFRAANVRANQVLEAEVTVTIARQTHTPEGIALRRLYDLSVLRARQPLFALSWTIMHPIDAASPLFGATPESLLGEQAEIVIVLSGVDETFAQRIHARHSYIPSEIVWDRQFEDILHITPDGRRLVDYGKFHALRPASPEPG
jgi:inward rectifier potassium channel